MSQSPAADEAELPGATLLARFNSFLATQKADTPELKRQAFALRYQVYCLERQFEDLSQHPKKLETDKFDSHALHGLVTTKANDRAIGTARLILPENRQLPILGLLHSQNIDPERHFPISGAAEVSRFAITRQFPRRRTAGDYAPGVRIEEPRHSQLNLPCLGLIQMLLRLSLESEVRYWVAMMEPKLLRMLAMMGIHFSSIGALVMHHGLRQPSVCHLPSMLATMRREKPDYWFVITNGGRLFAPTKFITDECAA